VRIGINHSQPREDGGFTELEPTYHDLVQFGKGAERTADLYIKGDKVIAYGNTRVYDRVVDGERRVDKQFIATSVSPDANLMNVILTRRNGMQTTNTRQGLQQAVVQAPPEQAMQQPTQQLAAQIPPPPPYPPPQQPPAQQPAQQVAQLGTPAAMTTQPPEAVNTMGR
jgi:single-strand DNA-binding protein